MVLGSLVNHPELLSRDTLYELRNIVARYPYFQTARLLMLNNMYLLHDPGFGAELRRSVLYVSDRRALWRLIEGHCAESVMIDEAEPIEEPTVDRTMSLIDAFLGTLPEEFEGFPLVTDTVGDYAERFLMGDNQAEASLEENAVPLSATSDDDSVGRALELLARNHAEEGEAPTLSGTSGEEALPDEDSIDEGYFTETLAKIYIKQHKYSRALEIIRSLYLQFPEKNAYFADQIRFLEKLIINNNLK